MRRVMIGVAAVVLGLPGVGAGQEPDLSGVWLLNWELSDDPNEQTPSAVGDGGRRGSRPGGGFRGPGGYGGRGGWSGRPSDGNPPDPERMARAREAIADLLTAPRQMTIEQNAREIRFAYDDGRYVRIVPDNKEHAGIAGTTEVIRKAGWKNGVLVVEVRPDSGPKVIHELELRLEGEQLVVTTTIEPRGSQDEIRLRRVYDATGE